MKLFTAALLLGAVSAVTGKTPNLRSSRNLEDEVVYGTYLEADIQYADRSDGHLDAIALPDGTILDIEDADDADDDVKNRGRGWFKKHGYESGDTEIALTGRVVGSKFKLKKLPPGKDKRRGRELKDQEDRRRLAMSGEKTVLALRVEAPDSTTSSSEAVISDKIFGTGGDNINLKSQYAACSHDQLNFIAAAGNGITNGVSTVSITQTVNGVDNSVVRNAVTAAGNTKFGTMQGQFDYVMECLPPGTSGGWIAYAYINWYLSVYNNQWCNYPSAQLHEIGHNIGLAHAGEGTAVYADQSGMMGYSYSQDEGPVMCFNAAKNFQLDWFNDRFESVTSTNRYWSGNLVGQIDYSNIPSDSTEQVGIRITNSAAVEVDGNLQDYYVSFNRKESHNRGTVEGGDQVLIHRRDAGTDYKQSWLVAKLNAGGSYTIPNYDGEPLTISVDAIDLSATRAFATVTVGTAPSPAPTKAPTNPPPTKAPTEAPTKQPSPAPTPGPTKAPTNPVPTTKAPTKQPTTGTPTKAPTIPPPTKAPTKAPTTPFSCETAYSIKDTCNPDPRCFWGTKSSCSPTNSGNTSRNKCCPSSGGPTPSPPPTPSPGPGPGPGPEPATCGEIPDNGTCKATSGCRWSKGSCVDGNGGAEFCFGKNGSCSTDSDCCSGSCKGNGRCE